MIVDCVLQSSSMCCIEKINLESTIILEELEDETNAFN